MYDLIARFAYLAYTYHADLVKVKAVRKRSDYPQYRIELYRSDNWRDSFGKERAQLQFLQTMHRYC